MIPAKLRLENYFLTEDCVSCRYAENLHEIPVEVSPDDFECEVGTLTQQEEAGLQAVVTMRLKTKDEEEIGHLHYNIVLEVIGRISFADESIIPADAARAEQALVINASNLLYGVLRERVYSKTATMMWGALLLPTVTFGNLRRQTNEEAEKEVGKSAEQKKED